MLSAPAASCSVSLVVDYLKGFVRLALYAGSIGLATLKVWGP